MPRNYSNIDESSIIKKSNININYTTVETINHSIDLPGEIFIKLNILTMNELNGDISINRINKINEINELIGDINIINIKSNTNDLIANININNISSINDFKELNGTININQINDIPSNIIVTKQVYSNSSIDCDTIIQRQKSSNNYLFGEINICKKSKSKSITPVFVFDNNRHMVNIKTQAYSTPKLDNISNNDIQFLSAKLKQEIANARVELKLLTELVNNKDNNSYNINIDEYHISRLEYFKKELEYLLIKQKFLNDNGGK